MHLADDVAAQEQRDGDGAIERYRVDLERRCIVHFVGADSFLIQKVDDVLAGLELHQSRAVVLAHLRERRPHVAQDLGVMLAVVVAARRAAAEELALGQ